MTNFLKHPTTPEQDAAEQERYRKFEADFTPLPVAELCLRRAFELYGRPQLFLDPCAGGGVWLQAAGNILAGPEMPYRMGVDIREEEAENIGRHADDVLVADFLRSDISHGSFDMVASNPPFSLFAEFDEAGLTVADTVCLFAPVDVLGRSEEGARWLKENAHHIDGVLWVPGSMGFRGKAINPKTGKPYGVDFRNYGLWCLQSTPGDTADVPTWHVELLDWLPGEDRRWTVKPGTEPGSVAP